MGKTLSPDFTDLLTAFAVAGVRYLIVGGYAVGYYHRPRATKDLDLWIDSGPENRERLVTALTSFGVPPGLIEQVRGMKPDEIVYFGKPPLRVDLLGSLAGLSFEQAFEKRSETSWDGVPVSIIAKGDLIVAKKAAGRPQDRLDLRNLGGQKRRS